MTARLRPGRFFASVLLLAALASALTYDAVKVIAEAVRAGGKLESAAVRDALPGLPPYSGVTGMIKYSAGTGDPVKGAVILRIKNGAFAWFADAQP